VRGRRARRYFDKDYFMKPFFKSGYSPEQGYTREGYLPGAIAQLLVNLYGREGRWLEAGCAFGWVMERLVLMGVDVYGFDISKYAIRHAPKVIRRRVYCHDGLEQQRFSGDSFDFIYSFETAEHVYIDDVPIWLRNLYSWARSGASLFMTVCLGVDNCRGAEDPDLSHQTLQPRDWWDRKILDAGWLYDDKMFYKAHETAVLTSQMDRAEVLVSHYNWHIFPYMKP